MTIKTRKQRQDEEKELAKSPPNEAVNVLKDNRKTAKEISSSLMDIKRNLRTAISECSCRGLKFAAKWYVFGYWPKPFGSLDLGQHNKWPACPLWESKLNKEFMKVNSSKEKKILICFHWHGAISS
jgi:hypothetical protein